MKMPRPFGMRWFGLITIYCLLWAVLSVLFDSTLVRLGSDVGFLLLCFALLGAAHSRHALNWLLDEWL
jgi:hypothetical protein